jgi:hypothetical protein
MQCLANTVGATSGLLETNRQHLERPIGFATHPDKCRETVSFRGEFI